MLSNCNLQRDFDDPDAEFDHERIYDATDWDAPTALNIAHETVDRHADSGERTALYVVGAETEAEEKTFSDLRQASSRFANALEALGVERGDRVFSYLPRSPEHVEAFVGTLKAGRVFGGINERFGPGGIAYRLDDAEATCLVTTGSNLGVAREAVSKVPSVEHTIVVDPPADGLRAGEVAYRELIGDASPSYETVRTSADDEALLYYTSGTTGQPKGVSHTHRLIVGLAAMHRYLMDLREDDLYWSTADFGWLAGPDCLFGCWFWGVSFLTYRDEFDPEAWSRVLDEYPVTVLYSVPTAYRMLREHETALANAHLDLRHALSVGEPLDAGIVEWSRKTLGAEIHDLYGQTETGGAPICNLPIWEVRPGSMGKPFPDIEAAILDPETNERVEDGVVGEIAIDRSYPSLFARYWNRPEETEDAFIDNWYLTGDLAHRDEDGYYWFEGRADDVIISAGYRIGPFEVESCLNDHFAVAESAVVPEPDERRGNIVKAYVVRSSDARDIPDDELTDTLQMYVRDTLSAHEYPRTVAFVSELPKTVTGKIKRAELRAREDDENDG